MSLLITYLARPGETTEGMPLGYLFIFAALLLFLLYKKGKRLQQYLTTDWKEGLWDA